MSFDLTTAIPVREREDGLYEKDTFDLSTAVPVETIPEPAKQNWELLKDPSFQADFELFKKKAVGQAKDIYNLLIGRPWASVTGQPVPELEALPEVLPSLVQVLDRNIPIPPLTKQNIESVLKGKGITEKYEEGLEGNLNVLGGLLMVWSGVSAFKSFTGALQYNKSLSELAKSQLVTPEQAIAQSISQDYSKYEEIFYGTGKSRFPVGTPKEIKVKTIMEAMKDNPKLKAEVMADACLRWRGVDPNSIVETTLVPGEPPTNIVGKLKRLNQIIGETGSIPITRAKPGQKIVFEGRPGKIVSVDGERISVELLGDRGRIAIATLSQLSLPEAPKPAEAPKVPTEGLETQKKGIVEPQGEGIFKYYEKKPHWTELSSADLPRSWENQPITQIDHFSVPPEKQRQGIGTKMLTNIENEARQKGHKGVIITLPTSEGLAFYKKMGYKQSSELGAVVYKELHTFEKGQKVIYKTGNEEREVTISSQEPSDLAYGNGKGWKIKLPDGQNIWVSEKQLSKLSQPQGGAGKPPIEPPKTAVSGAPEEPGKEPIKINNLNLSPEARAKLDAAIESIRSELEKIKGKPLTHDEVLEAAKTSDILTSATSREATKDFEAKLLRTRQNIAAMAEEKGISEEFIKQLKEVRAAGTNLGRALGSLRIEADPESYNIKTKIVNQLNDLGVETDKIIAAAEGVDFTNQEQVTEFYRKFVKPSLWDLINEYRYINLLSSPKTHIVNTFSNIIQSTLLAPGTKLFMGDIKGVSDYSKGAFSAIGEAWVKALDALKGKTFVERPDVAHIPTGSKLLKWGRYIPQALEASDVFFRTIGYEGELAAQLGKGVDPKEAEKIAKEKASYYVFRKALDPKNKTEQGYLLSAIDKLTSLAYEARKIPILGRAVGWYIPFVQTPMNIAKQMIEYSPAGFTTLPGAKDKKEQLAKALLGSLIFGLAAYLVSKNESTWATPTNKKEKDLFFAAGRQSFSIKIGNTWLGYSRLGPLAFPIAIPAAIKYYTTQNPNSVTDNSMQKTAKVIGSLGEFFASMSYVEGIGRLMNLVKNAPGAFTSLVAEAPSQLIAVSSLQRWINNFIIDPVYRKTDKDISIESIIDNARKSIIFATKGLPAYETPEGEESRRSYPGLNAFSPIPVSKSNKEYEEEYKEYIVERKETIREKKEKEEEDKPSRRRR